MKYIKREPRFPFDPSFILVVTGILLNRLNDGSKWNLGSLYNDYFCNTYKN